MEKTLWTLLICIIILFGYIFRTEILNKFKPQESIIATSTLITETPKDPILEIIKTMSIEEKIGSLLILGFHSTTTNTHITELIQKYHVGGVNLLRYNIVDIEQTKKLSSELQELYQKDNHNLPFIIAVDQEGGTVVRFPFLKEKTAEPKVRTIEQATTVAKIRAQELTELGINMNFAPVADYITNTKSYLYNRTFATTTDGTMTLAKIMAGTYLENGIMPVYKHFPGYGNSTINPHKAVTLFDGTKEMFNQNIEVFRSVLEHESRIPVMTAHIEVPWIATGTPATKSKYFMTDMLRKEFNYQGVVITDDLDMVSAGVDAGKSAVDSILAGADILISTPNDTNHIIIINALMQAVKDGTISKERLDESVYRVLKLRTKMTMF
jgi:beta-N-acetylhexosaminidase